MYIENVNAIDVKKRDLEKLAQYQRTLWSKPQLAYLFFELTDSCNLSCKHCGSSCLSSNRNYLPFVEAKKVLDQVANAFDSSQILVCITGGEPLLSKDVFKIISYSVSLGYSCGITTNGTLLTDRVCCQLKNAGLDTISISLDGLENTHNEFRCNSNAFHQALAGIRHAKNVGLNPEVVTVVHKANLQELDLLYDMLVDEGIKLWKIANMEPIGRAAQKASMMLDAKEFKMLLDFIKNTRNRGTGLEVNFGCSHYLGLRYEHMVRDFYFQCGAGTMIASVMANGDIGACLDIERNGLTIQGNIYKDNFVDVWKNRFGFFRRNKAELSAKCSRCSEKNLCMGDSTHTWNFETNEPNYCVYQMMEA